MATKVGIIGGAGYVGLTTGACFAREGHQVICLDIDSNKVDMLNKGQIPIYEEGMEVLVHDNLKRGRLTFTTDYKKAVTSSDLLFICLPTPTVNGEADLTYVFKSLPEIAKHMDRPKVIVGKSTMPPGSGEVIRSTLANELAKIGKKIDFDYASNPEFLRQGSAVSDFIKPDRVVIGAESERARKALEELYYTHKVRGTPINFMNVMEAETVKYASNAFLAVKLSFVNGIANLCDALGLDAYHVLEAWADDKRIGRANMHPSPGYGGSCFPKDTEALASFARRSGVPQEMVEAAMEINKFQRTVMPRKIEAYFQARGIPLKGMTFGMLGLAFKAETDDMRDSSSIDAVQYLHSKGARVKGYDPAANEKARIALGEKIQISDTAAEATSDVDAVIIMTDWNEFKNADINDLMKNCKYPVMFDARNLFSRNPEKAEKIRNQGIDYIGIGTRVLARGSTTTLP